MPTSKHRVIVEEFQFLDELSELEPDVIRADEFVEGAKFVLSRNPEYGEHIAKNVWFLPMWRAEEGRSVVLYYTFDSERVIFLSIQLATD
jgi:hypothetical protein